MKPLLFLLLFCASLTASAQTIKMKITGLTPAAGEDVSAFEVSDTTRISVGGGGSSIGTVTFESIKLKKLPGLSSTELFRRSTLGLTTSDVTFEFYDAASTLYQKIIIRNALVGHFSYLVPECEGCSKLYHQVWFSYQKIEVYDLLNNNQYRYDLTQRKAY